MGVHRLIALILIACLMLSTLATLCHARTEARFELRTDGIVAGNDLYASTSRQTLFHQQSLDTTDLENYFASFTPLEFNAEGSPGAGVDIALPSIHEDSAATAAADSTGFFQANYNYRTETDFGNVPLSMAYPATVAQAISPAAIVITPMYPEQFGSIAIQNKLAKAKPAAAVEPVNETAANETKGNESANVSSIPLNAEATDTANTGFNISPGGKTSYLLNITGPKNASSKPEIPRLYPSDFDMLGKDGPVFPNPPGIGTFSTNGAGSSGASLPVPIKPAELIPAGSLKGNQSDNKTGNKTANETAVPAQTSPITPSRIDPAEFTYANFDFSAPTEKINDMTLVERMWRNAHRGGTMGKAYAGDTAYPLWIDPYERPNDVSMIDEHWYVLQSALNMCVPGTQILPRFWSTGFLGQ